MSEGPIFPHRGKTGQSFYVPWKNPRKFLRSVEKPADCVRAARMRRRRRAGQALGHRRIRRRRSRPRGRRNPRPENGPLDPRAGPAVPHERPFRAGDPGRDLRLRRLPDAGPGGPARSEKGNLDGTRRAVRRPPPQRLRRTGRGNLRRRRQRRFGGPHHLAWWGSQLCSPRRKAVGERNGRISLGGQFHRAIADARSAGILSGARRASRRKRGKPTSSFLAQ